MIKVYMEAYGCSANFADSEMISGILSQREHQIEEKLSEANLNIIVTCTVKNPTSEMMIHRIKELTATGKPLIVAGACRRLNVTESSC